MRRPAVAAAILLAVALVVAAVVGALRVRATPPAPRVDVAVPASVTVPGAAPADLPLPPSGSVAIDGDARPGVSTALARRDATMPHPIASVAKSLTALTVLALRPLNSSTDEGPSYRVTAADVAEYRSDLAAGGSVVPVSEGAVFTERQLLLALMLPSGNNIAETLARWAGGGDRQGFLSRAESQARSYGMTATHMADASGFDPATVASAEDLIHLGRAVLASPPLAAVVATRHATLPDGTPIDNLDTGLTDVPGWLGIKTGNSDQAGGCLLFAAFRSVGGDGGAGDATAAGVTVVGAVLGVHSLAAHATGTDDRAAAIDAAERATTQALGTYSAVSAPSLPVAVSGGVTTDWGAATYVRLGAAEGGHVLVGRPGDRLTLRTMSSAGVEAPLSAGASVATVDAVGPQGQLVARWAVVTTGTLEGPSWSWRLRYG